MVTNDHTATLRDEETRHPGLPGARVVAEHLMWSSPAHNVDVARARASARRRTDVAVSRDVGSRVDDLLTEHCRIDWSCPTLVCQTESRCATACDLSRTLAQQILGALHAMAFEATACQVRVPVIVYGCAPVLDLFGYTHGTDHGSRIPTVVEIKCGATGMSTAIVGAARSMSPPYEAISDSWHNRCMAQLALQKVCVEHVLATPVSALLLVAQLNGRVTIRKAPTKMCKLVATCAQMTTPSSCRRRPPRQIRIQPTLVEFMAIARRN
jgi:hypothetical protein